MIKGHKAQNDLLSQLNKAYNMSFNLATNNKYDPICCKSIWMWAIMLGHCESSKGGWYQQKRRRSAAKAPPPHLCGSQSHALHPMYISSIGSLIKKKKRSATLDLGLSHFNSLRQQTALTSVSTNHHGHFC